MSEWTGHASRRVSCEQAQGRGTCLGLGCVYDTARGCRDSGGGNAAGVRGRSDRAASGREDFGRAKRRPGGGWEKERGGAGMPGEPGDDRGKGREGHRGETGCEDAAMQRRKECKANPMCVYDTALGCYTRK